MINVSHQGAGVGGVRCVVLQEARQAEVRHFTHQVTVNQNVPGRQVTMYVVHIGQVLHPCSDATQHANQLDDRKLPVVLLHNRKQKHKYEILPFISHIQTRTRHNRH